MHYILNFCSICLLFTLFIQQGKAINNSDTIKEPKITFQACLGGEQTDAITKVLLTQNEELIICGKSKAAYTHNGNGPFVNATNYHGSSDILISKLDSDYNVVWSKYFGGNESEDPFYCDLVRLKSQTLLITNTKSIDGDIQNPKGGEDVWIVAFDDNGTMEWSNNYGGSGLDNYLDIQPTSDGGFVFLFSTTSVDGDVPANMGNQDGMVFKCDSLGNIQWKRHIAGAGLDRMICVTEVKNGDYLVAGVTNSIDGTFAGAGLGSNSGWVALRLDSAGNVLDIKNLGLIGVLTEFINVIQISDSTYGLVGWTLQTSGIFSDNHGAGEGAVLILNDSLNIIETKLFGGTRAEWIGGISKSNLDGWYTTGYSNSKDFDIPNNHSNNKDLWICHFTDNFDLNWSATYGTTDDESALNLAELSSGELIIGTSVKNNLDNNGDVECEPLNDDNNSDGWLIKIDPEMMVGLNCDTATHENFNFKIYPNPSDSETGLTVINKTPSNNQLELKIFDLQGKLIFENIWIDSGSISIETKNISAGAHILQIACLSCTENNSVYTEQILLL